jgi:hypothetical protein
MFDIQLNNSDTTIHFEPDGTNAKKVIKDLKQRRKICKAT